MRSHGAAVFLTLAVGVLGAGGARAQERAAERVFGAVFLEDQEFDHSGTTVDGVFLGDELSAAPSWAGLAAVGLAGLLLVRRRRGLALLALAASSSSWAELQVLSAADGAYELSPPGGGAFGPGLWRAEFRHEGYLTEMRTFTLTGSEPRNYRLADVTLRRVPATPTPVPTATPQPTEACTIFPADNPWNTDISDPQAYPVHPNSDAYVDFIGRTDHLHPDFGTFYEGAPIGIPYVVVPASQPKLQVDFDYADESDPGPYPIPPDPPIEGGPDSDGDRHILMLDLESCLLYELFAAYPPGHPSNPSGSRWYAGSGAIFDLRSNALRPEGWTSADAAGLPILPGLVRYDEVVEQGVIDHALRFTVRQTQRGYIHPATHFASDTTAADRPPMGLRFRMKPGYDCSGFSAEVQVICAALKKYGMMVADNGSDWYVSGAHDPRWDDDRLGDLKDVPGGAFEAVFTGPIITGR